MQRHSRIAGHLDYGGVLLVPVGLNGTRLYFMVDTGASYCTINRMILDQITAEPTDIKFSIAPIGKEEIITAVLKVETFVVGDKIQKNVLVSVVDFPPSVDNLDGILGMDFMGKYRITIEPDTQTLILRQIPKKK